MLLFLNMWTPLLLSHWKYKSKALRRNYSKEEFFEESTHATEELYEKWQEIKLLKLDWVSKTKRQAKERKKRREKRAEKLMKK